MAEMKRVKTRIAIVLDKSGSMASGKAEAIQGLNEQIQQAKERSGTQDLRCSLVTFNGEVFEHLWDVPAEQLVEAKPEDFKPNGATAWYDAVGYTIQKLLSTEQPGDDDTAYLLYVISDGQTNSDMRYNPDALKELTESCLATKRWTITYMGHNIKYLEQQARSTGVPVSNCAAWSNKTGGSAKRGFTHQKQRLNKFFDERSAGKLATSNYASDGLECADFTGHAPEVAPVADIVAVPEVAVKVDIGVLMGKLPHYTNVYPEGYEAGQARNGLFGQSVGVKWTQEQS